jgi:hypothetical protein
MTINESERGAGYPRVWRSWGWWLASIAAAFTPITFDGLLLMWSKYLAGGYYDHPPGRGGDPLGTLIAGDTEFGVRLVSSCWRCR